MRDPGVAAVLSAIIPGVGQFYNGRFLAGILWLIITPGLWIGTGGLPGWTGPATSASPARASAPVSDAYSPPRACGLARVVCSAGSATSPRPTPPTRMRGTIADVL